MNNLGRKRTLFHSFRDAFCGIGNCIVSERNMRVHLTACCYVLFFAVRMSLTRAEIAVLAVTVGAVMSAEAMNTAVEKLCDFAERHLNPYIRVIKDIAAGAVLLCALAAIVVGAAVFVRPELWQVLCEICTNTVSLVIFVLSLIIAWMFVFVGPRKIADFFKRRFKKNNKSAG